MGMVNENQNSNQTDRSSITAKSFNPGTRWTLLFIGNHGKPITLKRFKGMVLFTLFLLCVSIVFAAGLFLWNRNILGEMNQLESHFKNVEEQNRELRHEKDILLTRLVVAESRTLEKQGSAPQKQTDEELAGQPERDTGHAWQSVPFVMTKAKTETNKQVPGQPKNDPPGSGLSVAIDKFKVSLKSGSDLVRVQFRLKNTSRDSKHVSGHAIVVLRGKEILPNQWVALPAMSLIEGKPTGRQQGNSFGISNFKIMRFTARKLHFPEKFQTASVYVFTEDGELLLERDFPLKLFL